MDVMCVGTTVMDILVKGIDLSTPFVNRYKRANNLRFNVGGDAANEATTLAKLGNLVGIQVGVGDDAVGRMILHSLESAGVDTSFTKPMAGSDTLSTIVVIADSGQRDFIASPWVEAIHYTPDTESFKDAKIVALGSIFEPPFDTVESIHRVVKAAKEAGAVVCSDMIYNEIYFTFEEMKDVYPYIDYFFPNYDEAVVATGKTDLNEIADVYLKAGVKNIVIKTGADGCFIKNADGGNSYPAFHVDNVVDTTGAGDNFAAGFMTGLVRGYDLAGCAEYGAATASIAVQNLGASGFDISDEMVKAVIAGKR